MKKSKERNFEWPFPNKRNSLLRFQALSDLDLLKSINFVIFMLVKMHLTYFHRFFASIMAVLILGTSTCFSMDVHICKGEVESIAFLGLSATCKKEKKAVSEDMPMCCKAKLEQQKKEPHFSQKPCCSNKAIIQQSTMKEQFPTVFQIDFQGDYLLVENTSIATQSNLISEEDTKAGFQALPPPDLHTPLYILHEAYLI